MRLLTLLLLAGLAAQTPPKPPPQPPPEEPSNIPIDLPLRLQITKNQQIAAMSDQAIVAANAAIKKATADGSTAKGALNGLFADAENICSKLKRALDRTTLTCVKAAPAKKE